MYVMTHFDYRMEGYCRLASLLLWTFVALDDREPGDKWTPLAAWVVYRPFEQVCRACSMGDCTGGHSVHVQPTYAAEPLPNKAFLLPLNNRR